MNTKQLEELYLRHLNGEQLDEEEMAMVQEWLAKDKKNKDYLEQLHKAAKANTLSEQFRSVDVDENWNRYKDTITRKTKERIDYSFSRNFRPNLLRIAAVIILVAASAAIIYLLRSGQDYSIQQVSSVSQHTEIRLSDGSTILLNRGSVLTYPKVLRRKRREVELAGEAYFNIIHKEKVPFYVYINDLAVQVLGTTFSIKETESGNTIVNVLSGKVAFYEKDSTNNLIQIEVGQKGIFNNSTGKFKQDWLDEDSTFFWNQGKLIFKNQSLAAVFKELEEVFSKSFIITDPEILRNKLTSKCEGLELDEILDEMSILFNIQYNIKGDTVYIQKDHE
jgi:transmembrane sensor